MEQAQHTAGPWEADEGGYGEYIAVKAGKRLIAKVQWNTEAQNEAGIYDDGDNASLIAAAPDLLEACQTAADIFDEIEGWEDRAAFFHAVIAKAKGASNPKTDARRRGTPLLGEQRRGDKR